MFTKDIDNAARPFGNDWEIGADEIAACTNTAYLSGNIWVDSANGYDNLCNECNDSLHPFLTVDTAVTRISTASALTGTVAVKIGPGTYSWASTGGISTTSIQATFANNLVFEPQRWAKKPSEMPLLTKPATTGAGSSILFNIASYTSIRGLRLAFTGNGGANWNIMINCSKPGYSGAPNHFDSIWVEKNLFDMSGITGGSAYRALSVHYHEGSHKGLFIRNNIFNKCYGAMFFTENNCCNASSRDSLYYVVNNTAYDCSNKFINISDEGGTAVMANITIANNLISSGNDTVFYGTAGYAVGPYTVYNTVYETSPTAHMFQGQAATYYTKSICDSSASTFLSTTITDTNFLRPAGADKAVDWANGSYAPSIDIWGNSRSQGTGPDAGAIESPYSNLVLTLANSSAGQETDAFHETGSAPNAELFSFRFTLNNGTATITQLVLSLSNVNGIASGDITADSIYIDANNNGAVDIGETTVGGGGVVNIGGATGTITFGTSFNVTAGTNYIFRGSVGALVSNDSMTVSLAAANISAGIYQRLVYAG